MAAGFFFGALTIGGFGMEQETAVPQQLTAVLQAVVILFLAVRGGVFRKGGWLRRLGRSPDAGSHPPPHPPPHLETGVTGPLAPASSDGGN